MSCLEWTCELDKSYFHFVRKGVVDQSSTIEIWLGRLCSTSWALWHLRQKHGKGSRQSKIKEGTKRLEERYNEDQMTKSPHQMQPTHDSFSHTVVNYSKMAKKPVR